MCTVKPQLRVVARPDRQAEQPSGLGPALGEPQPPPRPTRRTAPGRPWDHIGACWLPRGAPARRLADAAAGHGVTFDLAASLVIERSLCISDLTAIFAPVVTIISALDGLAAEARPSSAVSGAAAVYLRQLSTSETARQRPTSAPHAPVCLPERVAVRVADAQEAEISAMLESDLRLALAWERAAVLEQRTIAEWAMWQTLRLRALSGAPLRRAPANRRGIPALYRP